MGCIANIRGSFKRIVPMSTTKSSHFLKTGFFALTLALSAAAPLAAHASPLANDHSFISELNAAYGTHFSAQPAQAPAAK